MSNIQLNNILTKESKRIKNNALCLLGLFFIVYIAFSFTPAILGNWETSSFFFAYSPETIWPNLSINLRANIGGYEYVALDINRFLTNIIGLDLFTLRLTPIFFGIFSVVLFFQISKIILNNKEAALFAALLLSVNQCFFIFQHQFIILMPTFFGMTLCVYLYLLVDERKDNALIFLFALSCVIVSMQYQIARYCMLFIILFWMSKGIKVENKKIIFKPWVIDKNKNYKILYFFIFLCALLVSFNPYNIAVFFNVAFLSPRDAEHAKTLSEVINFFHVNMPVLMHSFLGGHEVYSSNSHDLIVSTPFKLINIPIMILSVLGVVNFFIYKRYRYLIFILSLFILTSLPVTLSSVFANVVTGISPYRIFFILLPVYMLVGSGIDLIFKNKSTYKKYILNCIFIGFVLFNYKNIIEAESGFLAFLNETNCNFIQSDGHRKYICNLPDKYNDFPVKGVVEVSGEENRYVPHSYGLWYYREHLIPLYKYSKLLTEAINRLNNKNDVYIINAPLTDFNQNISFDHMMKLNMPQMAIALYLAENDIDVNYAIPYYGAYNMSVTQDFVGFFLTRVFNYKTETAYRNSIHVNYPITYDYHKYEYELYKYDKSFWDRLSIWFSRNTHYMFVDYLFSIFKYISLLNETDGSNKSYHFSLHRTDKNQQYYLVTTREEKEFIEEYLNNKNILFEEISI